MFTPLDVVAIAIAASGTTTKGARTGGVSLTHFSMSEFGLIHCFKFFLEIDP